MERFEAAATQVDVRHLDVEHNSRDSSRTDRRDGCGRATVVFPEASVTGHNGSQEVIRLAEPHGAGIFRAIQRQAADCDVLARDNGVYAVFSDQVGFDGHSTKVGGAYVLAPDGALLARSEPGRETGWIAAELDPELLRLVRENPAFALRKRRPDTYDELTLALSRRAGPGHPAPFGVEEVPCDFVGAPGRGYDRPMPAWRRRLTGAAGFVLPALIAELTGRSIIVRLDRAFHVVPLATPTTRYYPFLLAGVRTLAALLLAAVAWRLVRAHATAVAGQRLLGGFGHRPPG